MRTPVALLAVVLLVAGCSSPEGSCTAIAARSGVGVTVDKAIASTVSSLTLRVCWDGKCQDHRVSLNPGTDTVDQGCSGAAPDSGCSATVVPNATLDGFADIVGLPAGPVSVGGTATISGRRTAYTSVHLTAAPVFPNGPQCGGQGNQARVSVGEGGLR